MMVFIIDNVSTYFDELLRIISWGLFDEKVPKFKHEQQESKLHLKMKEKRKEKLITFVHVYFMKYFYYS
jgi:hypothetical protein